MCTVLKEDPTVRLDRASLPTPVSCQPLGGLFLCAVKLTQRDFLELCQSGLSHPGLSHLGLSHSGLSHPGLSHSGLSHS